MSSDREAALKIIEDGKAYSKAIKQLGESMKISLSAAGRTFCILWLSFKEAHPDLSKEIENIVGS